MDSALETAPHREANTASRYGKAYATDPETRTEALHRSEAFLKELHEEKKLHKQHRHEHVIRKLMFASTFFGLGQLVQNTTVMHLFLYVVPFFAMAHDLYIMAEDFKVKRIGRFVRPLPDQPDAEFKVVSPLEYEWEKNYLLDGNNREQWASIASLVFTALVTVFSAYAIYALDVSGKDSLALPFKAWLGACAACMMVVVGVTLRLRVSRDT